MMGESGDPESVGGTTRSRGGQVILVVKSHP